MKVFVYTPSKCLTKEQIFARGLLMFLYEQFYICQNYHFCCPARAHINLDRLLTRIAPGLCIT